MSEHWADRAESADVVVRHVQSGDRVFIHGAAATPTALIEALSRRTDLEGVEVYHLHLSGQVPFADADQSGHVFSNSLFTGPALRKPIAEGRADYIPVFLSDIPGLFESRVVDLDVALLQLSAPDSHGFCSLGPSVDAARSAARNARTILAEVNHQMPRTHGYTAVPLDAVDHFVATDRPLIPHEGAPETEVEARIGELVADLVEDGSTLQVGIGGIPDAALARMHNKIDLGVHTEMFSDRMVDLIEGGVVTNQHKKVHRGRTVTSFVMGSQRLYDFIDDHPLLEFHPCDRTNDTALIRKNPRVVAINSAIEVDLTGQVCADSIGHSIFSGIGGQMDFIRGAALSPGGKPIIALPSTAARGAVSRISSQLNRGAGVVTTRGHVHWVVTEYGAVNLHGRNLRQRAEALISIAHPDFRSGLRKDVRQTRHFLLS